MAFAGAEPRLGGLTERVQGNLPYKCLNAPVPAWCLKCCAEGKRNRGGDFWALGDSAARRQRPPSAVHGRGMSTAQAAARSMRTALQAMRVFRPCQPLAPVHSMPGQKWVARSHVPSHAHTGGGTKDRRRPQALHETTGAKVEAPMLAKGRPGVRQSIAASHGSRSRFFGRGKEAKPMEAADRTEGFVGYGYGRSMGGEERMRHTGPSKDQFVNGLPAVERIIWQPTNRTSMGLIDAWTLCLGCDRHKHG